MLPVRFHSRPSAAKQAGPRLTKRLIFRDGVNKDNYDTLITALIPAGAAVLVNGPGRRGSTQVVSRDPREPALTPSCPHLGETVILSARRKRKRGEKKKEKCPPRSCQECLQLHGIKHSSNAIFTVCDVGQSAFHRLSNDV